MKKTSLTYFLYAGLMILLILIVSGGTYAFFTATARDNDKIKGTTASKVDLELDVSKISTSANQNLIPLDNDVVTLTTAAKGYNFTGTDYDSAKSCIDKNGYSVCQVYEIKIKNNSTASVVLDGGVTSLYGENTPNIACAVMNTSISVTNNSTCLTDNAIADNLKLEAGGSKTFYIMVYINNLHTEQHDTGDFKGTVTFSGVSGGVTAEFE